MKKTRVLYKWNNEFYVKAYQLARTGADNSTIASALGVTDHIFSQWRKTKPALNVALQEARQKDVKLSDWIYGKLDGKYKRLWDRICRVEKEENGVMKVELLFDRYGEGARKYLFLYALVNSHFNPSVACRRVNISYDCFKRWIEDDPEFGQMVSEIEEHKDNYFESRLIELVDEREPKAVIFVNKTRNKKRGYGEKLEVEHTGTIRNEHVIELSDEILNRLSKSSRKELLQAMDQVQQLEDKNGQPIEAMNGH